MIIRTSADNPDDPKPKSEDLWDGQVCLTDRKPASLFIWDGKEHESRVVCKSRFIGREGALTYLNSEKGFDAAAAQTAAMLYERSEEWHIDDVVEHDACKIVSDAIGVGNVFFGRRVFKHLTECGPELPEGHFMSGII